MSGCGCTGSTEPGATRVADKGGMEATCPCTGSRGPDRRDDSPAAEHSCSHCGRATTTPRARGPGDGELKPGRGHWCGTGARDRGYLLPVGQAPARQPSAFASWQLTPFGAWPLRRGQSNLLDVFEVTDRWQHRARQGDTGLLMPNRATSLRPDRAAALVPGRPIRRRARDVDPVTVPERIWRQWPTAFRNIATARGARPPARVTATTVLGAARKGSANPTPYKPILVHDEAPLSLEHAHLWWLTDPCGCEGTYECALAEQVVMDYAGAKLCVPMDWFWEHVAYDSWYGQEETMDILWANVRSRGTGMDPDVLDNMIDCWMIDTEQDRTGRTYSMFFAGGHAPKQFVYYALDMIRRNAGAARDDWSGTTWGVGFAEWLAQALDGKKVGSQTDDRACSIKVRVRASGSRLAGKGLAGRCEDKDSEVECGETDNFPAGDFDAWRASLRPPATADPSILILMPDGGGLVPDSGTVSAFADISQQSVNFPANVVAFNGYSLDFSLFWARAALQYFCEELDWSGLQAAAVWARAAQTIVFRYVYTATHELGHLHFGEGGHCVGEDAEGGAPSCYFDMAAQSLACFTSGRLGLPHQGLFSCTGSGRYSAEEQCGVDGREYSDYWRSCDRGDLCVPNNAAIFSATPCFVRA